MNNYMLLCNTINEILVYIRRNPSFANRRSSLRLALDELTGHNIDNVPDKQMLNWYKLTSCKFLNYDFETQI